MKARSAVVAAVAAAALLFGPLHARAACSLNFVDVPVDMRGAQPFIAVKVNGQPADFLLDSGASFSMISSKFAVDHKLQAAKTAVVGSRLGGTVPLNYSTEGAGGAVRNTTLVSIPSFEIGGTKFKNATFATSDNLGAVPALLGHNFLHLLDNEFDFKAGKVKLVDPKDCASAVLAYWAKPGEAYSMLPLERDQFRGETAADITINGVKMVAIFDTGASGTYITERAAARAGVKVTDPGVRASESSKGVDRSNIKTWIGTFSSVKIGDEEIKNTSLRIAESAASDFDVLLGADFFLAHHVYVANSQGKIYFTYSGGPVFNVQGAPAAQVPPTK